MWVVWSPVIGVYSGRLRKSPRWILTPAQMCVLYRELGHDTYTACHLFGDIRTTGVQPPEGP